MSHKSPARAFYKSVSYKQNMFGRLFSSTCLRSDSWVPFGFYFVFFKLNMHCLVLDPLERLTESEGLLLQVQKSGYRVPLMDPCGESESPCACYLH